MEWIELGELGEVLSGYAFKSKKYVNKGIRVIRITNVQNGYLEDDDPKYYSEEDIEGLERYLLFEDDILISLTGNVGRVAKLEKKFLPAALNQRVACVRANTRISDEYLYYMLNSNYFENRCISQSKGVAQKNLGITNLKKIKIPVPPMEIQEKIVKVLDQAQALIDKRKKQIEDLDQLIESIFYTMFGDPVRNEKGWKIERLKDITSKIGSGSTPRGGESSYKESGISLIRSMNVYDNNFKYDGLAYIDEGQAKLLSNVIVENNDVLINITGASITRATIVPKNILPARVNQHVSILRCNNQVAYIYLLHLLISKKYKQKIYYISTSSGATREALTKENLENLEIPIPPISLQNEFAQKVEVIEKQKKLLKESLELLEENYKSIMTRAFSGELFK